MLAFAAEHSSTFPFTLVPDVVQLAKNLANDKKALDQVKLSRTTASYKVVHGIGKFFQTTTIEKLKKYPFSLNVDESTSSNNRRVLTYLVSYYDPEEGKCMVEHLQSSELIKVDTESIYVDICSVFQKFEIPWKNLVSILMDSCAVMRGKQNGLEARIRREKVPTLLDIDGDSCHHIHNAAKKFTNPFDGWVEQLYRDLHTDHKWSVDLRDMLAEICELMGVAFTMPPNYIPHRWLSVYDVGISTKLMMAPFKVFYYAFIPKDMQDAYKDVVKALIRKCSSKVQERIWAIVKVLNQKNSQMMEKQEKNESWKKSTTRKKNYAYP